MPLKIFTVLKALEKLVWRDGFLKCRHNAQYTQTLFPPRGPIFVFHYLCVTLETDSRTQALYSTTALMREREREQSYFSKKTQNSLASMDHCVPRRMFQLFLEAFDEQFLLINCSLVFLFRYILVLLRERFLDWVRVRSRADLQ